jgi:hypothetical protein
MTQELFELWHAGKRNPRSTRTSSDVAIEMFAELDEEATVLSRLIEEGNAWEAFCRVNSWLHALNKYVTWSRGETGAHRADLETQQVMGMFLRWIGDNRKLIGSTIAGIGGGYHSLTVSPSGILLSVSFWSQSQSGPDASAAVAAAAAAAEGADEATTPAVLPQPAGQSLSAPPPPQAGAPGSVNPGQTGPLPPTGPLPNDIRYNAFYPNRRVYPAGMNNRTNQASPNGSYGRPRGG